MSITAKTSEALAAAWRYHQAGELTRAEESYRQALHIDPARPEAWHLLGAVRYSMNRLDDATECFRRALSLKPDYAEPRNFLAVTLVALGQFDEAIAEFRRAIASHPSDAELRFNLGLALKRQGLLAEAENAWKATLELNPTHAGARRGLHNITRRGLHNINRESVVPVGTAASGPEALSAKLMSHIDATGGDLGEVLDRAWRAHVVGDLAAAEFGYRRALEIEANQPDVWYLLGAVSQSCGRVEDAIDFLKQAIHLNPDYADAHNYLAVVFVAKRRLDEAAAHFRTAISLRPLDPELHVNLGLSLRQQGRSAAALEAFRQAVLLRPDHAKAHSHLRRCLRSLARYDELIESYRTIAEKEPTSVTALHSLGLAQMEGKRFGEAAESFRRALQLEPESGRIRNNLGLALAAADKLDEAIFVYRQALRIKPDFAEIHNNLAVALGKQDRIDDSIAHYQEAIRLLPEFAQAHANLGGALASRERFEEAEKHQQRAINLRPNFAEAHCNLGALLTQLGRLDEAETANRRAIELKEDFVEALTNLGGVLASRGDLAAAEDYYQRALSVDPMFPGARYNRSLLWLTQGRLQEGWAEYEFRWQCGEAKRRRYRQPRWDGKPLAGRTILVYAEQGLGDTIQFLRYLPRVAEQGGRVVFLCQAPLEPLLHSSLGGVEIVTDSKALPHFDVQVPLMSLPMVFGTNLDNLPAKAPYLSVDAGLVEAWRQELSGISEFKIGIAWQGNPKHRGDRYRSMPLAVFEPLLRLPDVRLFSLQKNFGREQLVQASFADSIVDLSPRDKSFAHTAAALQALDLLICCDTSLAHLAGALGCPVWLAIARVADWRWLLEREDSPWYPSLRLFRQRIAGDWAEVFERIVAALQSRNRVASCR